MALVAPRISTQDVDLSIDVCTRDRGLAIATYRNLVLTIWTERVNLAELESTDRVIRKLSEHHPSGIGFITIVNKMHIMGEAERRFAAKMLKGTTRIRGVANVYRDTGFTTAVLRAILTGLTTISMASVPLRVLPSVEAAADWLLALLPATPQRPTTAAVVAAISSMEAALAGERR